MTVDSEGIADAVIREYEKLPSNRRPVLRDNGTQEWVPLSGIVAKKNGEFVCLALATGMKCLPAVKLPLAQGVTLHDWHAEVLAIRAFNYFVLEECMSIVCGRRPSDFIQLREVAPCGDATVEAQSYRDMKMGEALRVRRQVKQEVYNEALKGWLSNTGDDTFGL
ncbi:hypothetical protein P8C59_009399 [Phyllachora maydis]|uniref:A to I editase domain-containing protein n=1 Tax=Phyllachora maydis TaxID=1825666 RepID=A0AAD9MG91_9PEZI|nr:hypothetical protein P8C59_009399 [Phyllachora maydis]